MRRDHAVTLLGLSDGGRGGQRPPPGPALSRRVMRRPGLPEEGPPRSGPGAADPAGVGVFTGQTVRQTRCHSHLFKIIFKRVSYSSFSQMLSVVKPRGCSHCEHPPSVQAALLCRPKLPVQKHGIQSREPNRASRCKERWLRTAPLRLMPLAWPLSATIHLPSREVRTALRPFCRRDNGGLARSTGHGRCGPRPAPACSGGFTADTRAGLTSLGLSYSH